MSQGYATDWQSACIPPTIRRPWNVWENFLEDHVAEASSQAEEVTPEIREQIASVQAKGARMAFMLLEESVQQQFVEVSYQELAAFANWRRSQVAQQESGAAPPATEFEGCWDLLNQDDKKEWLPQDAKAFLAADLQWAALVTNPLGQEVKKPFKGEKDQSKKVPVKEEVKKPVPAAEAKVKEEPRSEADRPKAPKEKAVVKQEKTLAVQQAPKEKAKPVQKHEAQKEKAVVVKQEKQTAPVQQQQAPKDKAKPVHKEAPREKAIVVKQEPKQTAAVSQQQPLKDKAVHKHEAPREKVAQVVVAKKERKQTAPVAPKDKAVEVKKEPVTEGVEKASAAREKATSSAVVAAEKPCVDKEGKASTRKKDTTSAAKVKSKAKAKAASLEQRPRKKAAIPDDEAEDDDRLMAVVPRSDGEDDEPEAPQEAPRVPKPGGRRGDAARSAPPGRMWKRQCRAPLKEVPENLYPEALEAVCCKCQDGSVSVGNDLAMCDRCDKAFHQKCHDPPVTYFGNPEDQWFCLQCTLEMAKMRQLQLQVDDFCWVQATGETVAWPAQVLRIDFSSLADPKPYWVQFFDAGPPEGAWVGEIHVKAWSDGPSFASIVQARRRAAVRLAEAAGATQISTEQRVSASRQKRPAQEDPENPHPRRRRRVPEDSPERPRRSRRGEANVPLLTEPQCPGGTKRTARPREHPECPKSPEPKQRQDADPASTEKQRRVDQQAQSKINETCDLIAHLKENQHQVDQEFVQQQEAGA